MKKRSLFERLSGSTAQADDYDFDDEVAAPPRRTPAPSRMPLAALPEEDHGAEGQLPVDVYQTGTEIVIRTFIAGVRPDDMNVSISRDMVTIEGSRTSSQEITDGDYFHQELFWGSFARTILLPQEVDVDGAVAGAKDGLLTITLPKLDKSRQTKLRIKTG